MSRTPIRSNDNRRDVDTYMLLLITLLFTLPSTTLPQTLDCPQGTFDGANCYIMQKPSKAFIYRHAFYVEADRSCELGSYDGANCYIMPKPPGGFIRANGFYVPPWKTTNCPDGTYDGANCFIMPKPLGGFVLNNSLYATPQSGNICSIGSYDGANCLILKAPWGTKAFEYRNGFYITPLHACDTGIFDGANCLLAWAPVGTRAFIYRGGFYTTPKLNCPSGKFDGANCLLLRAHPATEPFEYAGNFYTTPVPPSYYSPQPPTLSAGLISGDDIELSGSVASGVDGVRWWVMTIELDRKTYLSGFQRIASIPASPPDGLGVTFRHVDLDLPPDTYYYKAFAVTDAGDTPNSKTTAGVTVPGPPPQPITCPSGGAPQRYYFCMTCPGNYKTQYEVSACSEGEARDWVQQLGVNCQVDAGVCW